MNLIAVLEHLNDRLDSLGDAATTGDRAILVAEAGHRVWYARQEDRQFDLVSPGGGIASDPRKAFTTDVATLRARGGDANTFMCLVEDQGTDVRCVWDNQRRRLTPYVEFHRVDLSGGARPPAVEKAPPPPPPPGPVAIPTVVSDALIALGSATAARTAARKKLAHAETRSADTQSAAQSSMVEIAAIRGALAERLADDFLEGRSIGEGRDEARAVKKLEQQRTAALTALPRIRQAVADAKAELALTEAAFREAVLDWAAVIQRDGLRDCVDGLNSLLPTLASLTAIDRIKQTLCGEQLSTRRNGHPGLLSTEKLVAKLIRGMPDAVRSSAFHVDSFEHEVARHMDHINKTLEVAS